MLTLTDNLLIGSGHHRKVFFYPNDNTKCIKIDTKFKAIKNKLKNPHFYKKIRSLETFGENIKELRYYKKLLNKDKNGENVFNNIPRFYGLVNTNFGDGIVVEYINGIPLNFFLAKEGLTLRVKNAFRELYSNFIQYNIEIRDFIPSNYFVKELNNDQIKIYIIDGIGNSNFLPYSEWFSFIGKKKTIRRINKMILILKTFIFFI